VLDNTYVEGLSQITSLIFQDKIVQFFVLVIVGLISHYIYLKIKKHNALEKVTLFSLIALILIFLGYLLNQYVNYPISSNNRESLKVLTFKTHKKEYGYNEPIGVQLEVNKKAYFYLFSESKKKMIFPNNYDSGRIHSVKANTFINLNDAFMVENNMGQKDEKLILLVSTQKVLEYEELLGKGKGFPDVPDKLIAKSLKPNEFVSISYGESSEAQFAGSEINVHIKKIAIVINPFDNNISKQGEPLYIDATSSVNGYLTVFEGVPNNLHRIEGGKVRSDDTFRTQVDSLSPPFDEHIVVAIYSPKKERLTTNDFRVETQDKKGGKSYTLKFKDTSYPYAIRTHKVIK